LSNGPFSIGNNRQKRTQVRHKPIISLGNDIVWFDHRLSYALNLTTHKRGFKMSAMFRDKQ
jgi:hypothetical protein